MALQYAAFTAANLLKSPLRYELEQRASVDCVHVVELYFASWAVQSGVCNVSWQPGSVDAVTVEHTGEQSPAKGGYDRPAERHVYYACKRGTRQS